MEPNVHNAIDVKPLGLTAQEVVVQLRNKLMKLKAEFMTDDGKVNYSTLKSSDFYQVYVDFSAQLKYVDLSKELLSETERRAFFINIYNCLTIHVLSEFPDLPTSPLKVQNMWDSNAYDVGGHVLTLDDIEHGILRENKGHPSKAAPHFDAKDPRIKLTVKLDPRIHFALNCGANSCPPIKTYVADRLEKQLEVASTSFNSNIVVDDSNVKLSKLLLWYRTDFGSTDSEVLKTLAGFITDEETKEKLQTAAREGRAIQYFDYDWNLNSV